MFSLLKWLFVFMLFITKIQAQRCKTISFNNAQLVVYNTDHLSVIISVSGCIAPITLRAVGGNVRRVLCDDQHIPNLQEEAISSLSHLETIRFERSGITTITTGAFTNLPLLRHVYLTENQIETLSENTFVNVPKLQVLCLYKNNLQYFDKSWLGNVPNLEILDLSYNVIEFITRDAFENLTTLRILNIEHNNIRQITEKAFDDLTELETLDLSYNKIGRLYDNLFASSTHLSRLNLFGNSLTYVSEKVLETLRTVDELIILYNPWQCDCFFKIIDWNENYTSVKLNSKDLTCEKVKDISNIAVCVESLQNNTRCESNPKEDLLSVFHSEQPDYSCSLVKPYARLKERGDPCTTPNGKIGSCVPLDNCQMVFEATTSRKKDEREFARKSFCSYDTDTLVCCESPSSVTIADFESNALPDKTSCGLVKEESISGEFSWMAALEYTSKISGENAGIRCSGSVISSRYVLTAAHCAIDKVFEVIGVWLGDWKTSTNPDCAANNNQCATSVQKFQIKEKIPHFFYSETIGFNDIALLLLKNKIKFNDYIQPICLPPPNVPSPQIGTLMTAAGWEQTESGTASAILLKADISLVSKDNCVLKYGALSPQQLCVSDGGRNYQTETSITASSPTTPSPTTSSPKAGFFLIVGAPPSDFNNKLNGISSQNAPFQNPFPTGWGATSNDYNNLFRLPTLNKPSSEFGTGWGSTTNDATSHSVPDAPSVSNERTTLKLTPQQLCADGEARGVRERDSGGPIMIIYKDRSSGRTYWYQEGVSSFGVVCDRAGVPSVYTQTFSYMGWIVNVLANE